MKKIIISISIIVSPVTMLAAATDITRLQQIVAHSKHSEETPLLRRAPEQNFCEQLKKCGDSQAVATGCTIFCLSAGCVGFGCLLKYCCGIILYDPSGAGLAG
ncbi:MAG TPA: hypothetical protein VFF04_02510 [Candidatus Babeliales bacterium]|nr:hypothetical protein [Candidatus Babeliales bacterium]